MTEASESNEPGKATRAASPGWFATTRWSLVLNAGKPDSDVSSQAMASLCESYWLPLYTYIRRRGHSPHDAQDLTQEFFAFALARDHFAKADPNRGRFRSFLLGTLKKFLSDQRDKANAQKRGGGTAPLSLDFDLGEERLAVAGAASENPEKEFERAWTLALLERTMRQLRDESAIAGKLELFDAIAPMITGEKGGQTYAAIAQTLELTEGAIKMAVMRARRRFGELLREEIAHTVSSPAEIDEEIRGLFGSLRD